MVGYFDTEQRHLLFYYNIPAGCRCYPCLQNGDKSALCVYGAMLCAAQFLCQSDGGRDKMVTIVIEDNFVTSVVQYYQCAQAP